mmetsp:Transcript_43435/g.93045  ORF Transcript_43435/g.93045 Transcript_43435/m.93045 type:complete len:219 (+) Transcript_43435:1579-2235(+)
MADLSLRASRTPSLGPRLRRVRRRSSSERAGLVGRNSSRRPGATRPPRGSALLRASTWDSSSSRASVAHHLVRPSGPKLWCASRKVLRAFGVSALMGAFTARSNFSSASVWGSASAPEQNDRTMGRWSGAGAEDEEEIELSPCLPAATATGAPTEAAEDADAWEFAAAKVALRVLRTTCRPLILKIEIMVCRSGATRLNTTKTTRGGAQAPTNAQLRR